MKKVIAIVEDEPAIRDNYAAAFQRHGYAVRTYGTRKEAIDDPVVASDPKALQARLAALTVAQAEVERLYARWAELEAKVR